MKAPSSLPSTIEEAVWQGLVIARKIRRDDTATYPNGWKKVSPPRSFNQWQKTHLVLFTHTDKIVVERVRVAVLAMGAITELTNVDGSFVCVQKP